MILVDSSVWVDHLRLGEPELADLLEAGRVLMHPFVLGDLACGNLRDRAETLGLLGQLPSIEVASDEEGRYFIEQRALAGRGIGYIDAHLLAAAALAAGARLWTRDRRLEGVARGLGLAWDGV